MVGMGLTRGRASLHRLRSVTSPDTSPHMALGGETHGGTRGRDAMRGSTPKSGAHRYAASPPTDSAEALKCQRCHDKLYFSSVVRPFVCVCVRVSCLFLVLAFCSTVWFSGLQVFWRVFAVFSLLLLAMWVSPASRSQHRFTPTIGCPSMSVSSSCVVLTDVAGWNGAH